MKPLDKIPQKMCWKQKMGPKNMYFAVFVKWNRFWMGNGCFVFRKIWVFLLFFRYRLHTPLEVVGGFKRLISVPRMIVDIYSKFVSWLWIHIPSLFHATGRFKDDIASHTYNHIFFVMKYVIIYCVISIACPFRSIFHNMFSTVSNVLEDDMPQAVSLVVEPRIGKMVFVSPGERDTNRTRKEAGRFKETT